MLLVSPNITAADSTHSAGSLIISPLVFVIQAVLVGVLWTTISVGEAQREVVGEETRRHVTASNTSI